MKKIIGLLFCAVCTIFVSAQGVDETTLVVSGEGATKADATNVALRSAIEQAFGCFVSANTTIINDELVRDEIATVTSGNIVNYKELSTMPIDSNRIEVTIQATVSINKLVQYTQSKGYSCELAGATFMQQTKLLKLNVANTEAALEHLLLSVSNFVEHNNLYDISIQLGTPQIDGTVKCELIYQFNENARSLDEMFRQVLEGLSIPSEQQASLENIGFKIKHINGYALYADIPSCDSLLNCIDRYFRRRALCIITDNLNYPYPNPDIASGFYFSKGSNDGNRYFSWAYGRDCGYDRGLVGYGPGRVSLNLQMPLDSIDKITEIKVVPFGNPLFNTVVENIFNLALDKYARKKPFANEDEQIDATFQYFYDLGDYIEYIVMTDNSGVDEQLKLWIYEIIKGSLVMSKYHCSRPNFSSSKMNHVVYMLKQIYVRNGWHEEEIESFKSPCMSWQNILVKISGKLYR